MKAYLDMSATAFAQLTSFDPLSRGRLRRLLHGDAYLQHDSTALRSLLTLAIDRIEQLDPLDRQRRPDLRVVDGAHTAPSEPV